MTHPDARSSLPSVGSFVSIIGVSATDRDRAIFKEPNGKNIEEQKKELMNRLEIEYPCAWSYRVIGSDEKSLRQAISECVKDREYRVSLSNSSSSGKYISLTLETIVHSEEVRVSTYHSLAGHASVKIVL